MRFKSNIVILSFIFRFDINKLPKETISYVKEALLNEDIIYDDLDIKLNN